MHQDQSTVVKQRVREAQWMYLGPIAAAPIAHICVSLYRTAKTPRQKQFLLWGGIVGSTVMTLGMRGYLMWHAGYPGGENSSANERTRLVTQEEMEEIRNPSMKTVAREVMRGFA